MGVRQLAELRLPTGHALDSGTPFYEKLGEKRAEALLKALLARDYRIVSEHDARRATSLTPGDDAAQRTSSLAARKPRPERRRGGPSNGWLALARRARRQSAGDG